MFNMEKPFYYRQVLNDIVVEYNNRIKQRKENKFKLTIKEYIGEDCFYLWLDNEDYIEYYKVESYYNSLIRSKDETEEYTYQKLLFNIGIFGISSILKTNTEGKLI